MNERCNSQNGRLWPGYPHKAFDLGQVAAGVGLRSKDLLPHTSCHRSFPVFGRQRDGLCLSLLEHLLVQGLHSHGAQRSHGPLLALPCPFQGILHIPELLLHIGALRERGEPCSEDFEACRRGGVLGLLHGQHHLSVTLPLRVWAVFLQERFELGARLHLQHHFPLAAELVQDLALHRGDILNLVEGLLAQQSRRDGRASLELEPVRRHLRDTRQSRIHEEAKQVLLRVAAASLQPENLGKELGWDQQYNSSKQKIICFRHPNDRLDEAAGCMGFRSTVRHSRSVNSET